MQVLVLIAPDIIVFFYKNLAKISFSYIAERLICFNEQTVSISGMKRTWLTFIKQLFEEEDLEVLQINTINLYLSVLILVIF